MNSSSSHANGPSSSSNSSRSSKKSRKRAHEGANGGLPQHVLDSIAPPPPTGGGGGGSDEPSNSPSNHRAHSDPNPRGSSPHGDNPRPAKIPRTDRHSNSTPMSQQHFQGGMSAAQLFEQFKVERNKTEQFRLQQMLLGNAQRVLPSSSSVDRIDLTLAADSPSTSTGTDHRRSHTQSDPNGYSSSHSSNSSNKRSKHSKSSRHKNSKSTNDHQQYNMELVQHQDAELRRQMVIQQHELRYRQQLKDAQRQQAREHARRNAVSILDGHLSGAMSGGAPGLPHANDDQIVMMGANSSSSSSSSKRGRKKGSRSSRHTSGEGVYFFSAMLLFYLFCFGPRGAISILDSHLSRTSGALRLLHANDDRIVMMGSIVSCLRGPTVGAVAITFFHALFYVLTFKSCDSLCVIYTSSTSSKHKRAVVSFVFYRFRSLRFCSHMMLFICIRVCPSSMLRVTFGTISK